MKAVAYMKPNLRVTSVITCMKAMFFMVLIVISFGFLSGCSQSDSQDVAPEQNQEQTGLKPGEQADEQTAAEKAASAVAEAQASPSDEALAASEAANKLLSRIASKDKALISEYINAAYFDAQLYGIDEDTFIDGFFEGFSFEMGKVRDMTDSTAEVEVYLTTFDGAQAIEALGKRYQSSLAGEANLPALNDVWGQLGKVSHDEPFKLIMAKDTDGNWTVEDKASFGAALLGGLDPRQMAD